MKTLQETFNKVYVHLLTQNKKSLDPNIPRICRYRGHGGTKCAIGCLIPDELYDWGMEGVGVQIPTILEALRKASYPTDETAGRMYHRLQRMHDDSAVNDWKYYLEHIARDFNLKVPNMPSKD